MRSVLGIIFSRLLKKKSHTQVKSEKWRNKMIKWKNLSILLFLVALTVKCEAGSIAQGYDAEELIDAVKDATQEYQKYDDDEYYYYYDGELVSRLKKNLYEIESVLASFILFKCSIL